MPFISSEELQQSRRIIRSALREDIRTGDITTYAAVSPRKKAHAVIQAKSSGILAGIHFSAQTFLILNKSMSMFFSIEEGFSIKTGQTVLEVRGPAGAILKAERTALNLLGRMSGIATITAKMVARVTGTKARILDTRKTMPGLRIFDKYAVRVGGGGNHRFGLDDMFLIKENHIAAAGSLSGAVSSCVSYRSRLKQKKPVVVESSSLEAAEEAVEAGADRVLLDNMTPVQVEEVASKLLGKIELEVSGGITLNNVREYAETGVDYISVGMLTHSVPAVDFTLLIT